MSPDTQFVHLAWQREEKELADVKFTMASDANTQLSRMFDVYLEDAGVSLRGTYIISPDGTLMNSEVNFLNMGRNIGELMRKFKANLYLAKKTDEGCPSKWNDEGDQTLRPGPEMVGRVHEALRQ